jgi:LPXTG-motif cell wall-anchored protein
MAKKTITFIDLFAGIGGFHLAFHNLGAKCVFVSEWDKPARETYKKNFEKIVIKSQATATNMKAKNVACVDTPTVPGNNDGCDGAEVEVPKDPTPETPENPVPPTTSNVPPMPAELPQTGIADTFGAILASGSLTATFVAYFVSRRKI